MPMFSKTIFGDLRKLSITSSEDAEMGPKKKGYPRFKSKGQYKSFTYPESGFKLEGTRLTHSKIPGSIRVFKHREIEGTVKTCTIKNDGTGAWYVMYVIFVTETEDPAKVEPETAIGVDLGLSHAVVTSEGQYFDYPRYYVQAEAQNRKAEKSLHRKKNGPQSGDPCPPPPSSLCPLLQPLPYRPRAPPPPEDTGGSGLSFPPR